jgi:predicted alpha-1,2-mannosidase
MVRRLVFCKAFLCLLLVAQSLTAAEQQLVELANPLQGTDSVQAFSHGNLYPAIAVPFPMNAWAPYTQPLPDSFYYQYRQDQFCGIRQTHQPSPWINEYAAFAFMPVTGELKVTDRERASKFSHENETALPCHYRVYLDRYDASIEVTPTKRCASFRVTYGDQGPAYLVLDAFPGGSNIKILPEERKIIGVSRFNHGGVPQNFANYFVVKFDQPFKSHGTWQPGDIAKGSDSAEGDQVGAYLEFAADKGDAITYQVASSFISHEQAERNLSQEIGTDKFDQTLAKAGKLWNECLGQIEIEGGTEEQRRTFHSALYRSSLFPHTFYEINARGDKYYYSPYDGKVHEGVMYTDSGLWDTFRAVHPLFNLLHPEINTEILNGLLNAYDESGWLPAWASPGHRDCMIGNHAFSLFADAWVKGIRDFDAEHALEAMVHDANTEGPISCIGRNAVEQYRNLGYLPSPDVREATAKTLEFAYDDYCASVLARELGQERIADEFAKSSEKWRNVFDAEIGFVRGRKKDGGWVENFSPDEWGGPFTEGSSWHWTWCVFHDVDGLIDAMGGSEAFVDKLDEVFEAPPTVRVGSYGGLIHEMTEMIALDMGQYAHGNQPIQHMPYLYVHAGEPWKTQQRVREIVDELYDSSPQGLCGDEDNGQTSAWYVFSALGFYPVTPGEPYYVIGSPLFERATIKLPSGKTFAIEAENNSAENVYIQSAELNGKPLERAWLTHAEIADGGTLKFEMGPQPNTNWASAELPPSR